MLFFRIAKSTHDAVGRSLALDLLHAVAIARLVRQIEPLGDDPVQAAAGDACQPSPCRGGSRRRGRNANLIGRGKELAGESLQMFSSVSETFTQQRFARFANQQVKGDKQGGVLGRQLFHPAGGRMNPLQKIVERLRGRPREP